jgi:hypothetical protein
MYRPSTPVRSPGDSFSILRIPGQIGAWQQRPAPSVRSQRHLVTGGGFGNAWPGPGRPWGWQLSGILTAQSGQPYSGLIEYDLNQDGNFGPDRAPSVGRNRFRLPASVSLDPRLMRTVSIRKLPLQFMWEGFNVLNHSNIIEVNNVQYAVSSSGTDCGSAMTPCLVPQNQGLTAFGMPTQSSGARIMQLAIKLIF